MPACTWPQEYEIQFVRDHLGPLLESSGMPTKIWILDHNYNLWGRVVCSLEDEKLRRYCNAVAWHGYVGTPDMMTRVQDAYPEVTMHWTEGGPDYTDPALSDRLVQVGRHFHAHPAQLVPLHHLMEPGSRRTRQAQSRTISLRRRGDHQFADQGNLQERTILGVRPLFPADPPRRAPLRFAKRLPDLQHVALENPDGGQVLVVTNPGPARTIELRLANMSATVPLKADSLTTLLWK